MSTLSRDTVLLVPSRAALFVLFVTASLCARCEPILPESLARASREAVRLVSEQLLSADPTAYKPTGCTSKPYGGGWYVHYATVSLGMTALQCARQAGDTNLEARLVAKFRPYCTSASPVMNGMRHVDMSIVGALPLELAILTHDPEAARLGLSYADRQWEKPRADMDFGERLYDPQPIAEREANFAAGYTPETRLWIDDMYMITALQSQAYRLTGERRYIDRAAKEMCLYLERLQRADGLFNHGPDVPFVWGRGAGWMAAGMTLNLKYLPKDSPYRAPILAGYQKMMASLLAHQREDGLWGQLVNDPESYAETSGSAMFAYAFAEGVKRGWLADGAYRTAVVRATEALLKRLDGHGNLRDVCIGTGKRNDRDWYLTRPVCTGDPHGQAPLLWLLGSVLAEDAGTPFVTTRFTADPAGYVDGDTFYVFMGHDDDHAKGYRMYDWSVVRSTDGKTWEDLGAVMSVRETFPWARPERGWASQAVKRNGKWYWYVATMRKGERRDALAVAVADDVKGPWKDAIGGPLAEGGGFIDPSVIVDDDGKAYLFWGNHGGDPGLWYAELADDMISFKGEVKPITSVTEEKAFGKPQVWTRRCGAHAAGTPKANFVEAPWIYKVGDTYYLEYASDGVPESWSYSTAKSIHGPWTFGGRIMDNAGNTGTIHGGSVLFKGQWYMIYHDGNLPGGGDCRRSAKIVPYERNKDGSIPFIRP